MPSQGTLIQKGKDFSFNEKPKQTKPHFSLSVSRALSLLQKGCYQPGPDSAALRERKKPNKTNKKIHSYSELTPATSTQQAEQNQESRGEAGAVCGTSSHNAEPTAPGMGSSLSLPSARASLWSLCSQGPQAGLRDSGNKVHAMLWPGKR